MTPKFIRYSFTRIVTTWLKATHDFHLFYITFDVNFLYIINNNLLILSIVANITAIPTFFILIWVSNITAIADFLVWLIYYYWLCWPDITYILFDRYSLCAWYYCFLKLFIDTYAADWLMLMISWYKWYY